MIKCKFLNCDKQCKNINGISKHIKIHNISKKEYYDNFLKKDSEGICRECGKDTKFVSLGEGYEKYCHNPCPTKNEIVRLWEESIDKKYGKKNCSQLDWVKEKKKQTCLKSLGVSNPGKSKEVQKKMLKSMKENNTSKIRFEKIKSANKEKYGVEFASQNLKIKEKQKETFRKNYIKNKLTKHLEVLNLELLSEYKVGDIEFLFKCKKCNTTFESTWWNVYQRCGRCPKCFPLLRGRSFYEREVIMFIDEIYDGKIKTKYRKLISPLEVDLIIPNEKIAIEFDGLYWHSEQIISDPYYHTNKTNLCSKKGFFLIHIFEDEWIFKNNIVKERIKNILGLSSGKRIHARKCIIKEISAAEKNSFLEKFHLQGKDSSSIKLGAFYNDKLVSVMTFSYGNISKGSKRENGIWELNRFCSDYNYHIPGIASKLLTYFKRNYDWVKIFSYADRRWSDGNLYYKLNFNLEKITTPNYWYLKNSNRIHRFNLRKRPDEPKDIPEWILRKSEGYSRIWDCGNLKFVQCREG